MSTEKMVTAITHDMKYKLTRYFERGFDSKDLIILIPTRYFNALVGYVKNELYFTCENPTDSTETKSYIWGIEVKRVNDLDDIYVNLK